MTLQIPLMAQWRSSCLEVEAVDERGTTMAVSVLTERLLSIHLDGREIATLTTLGTAPGQLALGHLRTRCLLTSIDQIAAIDFDPEAFSVSLTSQHQATAFSAASPSLDAQSAMAAGSRCAGSPGPGGANGALLRSQARLSEEVILDIVARAGRDHDEQGLPEAVYACRLLSNAGPQRGELLSCAVDLSADGAVDTIAGLMWADGLPGADKILHVSGAPDAALVERCALLGIPFLLSPALPSLGAVAAAQPLGLTLLGGCRNHRFLAFSGAQRVLRLPATGFA